MGLMDYKFQWFFFFNEFYWIFCSFILFSLILLLLFELFLWLFGLIFRVMTRCIINILIVLTWVEQPLPSIKTSKSTLGTIAQAIPLSTLIMFVIIIHHYTLEVWFSTSRRGLTHQRGLTSWKLCGCGCT